MKLKNWVLLFTFLILGCGSVLLAQQNGQGPGQIALNASVVSDPGVNSVVTPALATDGEPPATDQSKPPGSNTAQSGPAPDDNQWHVAVSPYLWFPWVHGTVGAFGRDVGFSVSPNDLLSHARFGLMGTAEARRNWLLANVDLLYIRLGADKAIPFPPGLLATSANFTGNIFVLTPKVGVRLINEETVKAYFLTGIRYWYFGESVNFTPSLLGLNFSKSQSWVDPLAGARIEGTLSPKAVVTVAGDAGGWGTGSQIEYQVVGLLGYKLKPKMALQVGYRYLYFDRQKGGTASATANLALSGPVLGVTWNLK